MGKSIVRLSPNVCPSEFGLLPLPLRNEQLSCTIPYRTHSAPSLQNQPFLEQKTLFQADCETCRACGLRFRISTLQYKLSVTAL